MSSVVLIKADAAAIMGMHVLKATSFPHPSYFHIYYLPRLQKKDWKQTQVLTMVTCDGWDDKSIFFPLPVDMVFQVFGNEYILILHVQTLYF